MYPCSVDVENKDFSALPLPRPSFLFNPIFPSSPSSPSSQVFPIPSSNPATFPHLLFFSTPLLPSPTPSSPFLHSLYSTSFPLSFPFRIPDVSRQPGSTCIY